MGISCRRAIEVLFAGLLWSPLVLSEPVSFDVIISNGLVYDGSGNPPITTDIGIRGDRIAAFGELGSRSAITSIDASGLVVAPGFINSLSWATDNLIIDGRAQSDIRQGVTTEVFGEGNSMGPLNEEMRAALRQRQGDVKYAIPWTTLGEYLEHLEASGISPNVASFVGATTIRQHVLGQADRAPTADELQTMRALVRAAMEEGALGVGSALIYAPGTFATTEELIALVEVAASFDGMYISHLRSEGDRLLEAVDELVHIAQVTGAPAEIYHLKVSGRENWHKFRPMIKRIQKAQASGLNISANMYTYTAGSTGLDAAMPPWVQADGLAAWIDRLKDPAIRNQVANEMLSTNTSWENLFRQAGAEGTLLVGFKNPTLRKYIGQTLAEVAIMRDQPAHQTAIDLVIEDGSRVQVVYFLMSEENVANTIALPWVTFGSDAGAYTAAGHFLAQGTHPRAYGNFARVLGKFSREENRLTLAEAIHRLAFLPAQRFKLTARGALRKGYFADVVVFDAAQIRDHATYADPHQYASGVKHVLVNGTLVLQNGEHTGALPGQVVRGPGWLGEPN